MKQSSERLEGNNIRIEIEITPNNWVSVHPEELTDDHENIIDITIDHDILAGSSWYLNGNYTVPPLPVRLIN